MRLESRCRWGEHQLKTMYIYISIVLTADCTIFVTKIILSKKNIHATVWNCKVTKAQIVQTRSMVCCGHQLVVQHGFYSCVSQIMFAASCLTFFLKASIVSGYSSTSCSSRGNC